MNRNEKEYEPPKIQVYRFDDNDLLLTASGETQRTPDYAANALNELLVGTNTTIEIERECATGKDNYASD